MQLSYPASLTRTESGTVIIEFPDVPQALTEAHDDAEALSWAQDALVVALSGYLDMGRALPKPSKQLKGQVSIPVPPLVAAKLAIFSAMREQGISRVELATRLGSDEKQVRRLLDLDHNSRFDQIESALKCLGKALVVEVRDLATA
jgi:antitoxin HicB